MKAVQLLIALFFACLPAVAQAYCPAPVTYTMRGFDEQVNAYIDYLLCLHNDQVTTLNQHALTINQLDTNLDALQRKTGSYSDLENENYRMREQIAELEARLARIESVLDSR